MKQARIVFLEAHYAQLRSLLFDRQGIEGAAFVLCGQSCGDTVTKLLTHAVIPIADEDILRRESDSLSISSRALMRIAKLAAYERLSVVFAHSHPYGPAHFSLQDDGEETKLLPFLQARVPERVHGAVVLTPDSAVGRVYTPERTQVDRITVLGSQARFVTAEPLPDARSIFDRQVRAFGSAVQGILSSLHIGIVGLGGTGSAVAEQLYRLGAGHISLFDADSLAETNLNRVYGSSKTDVGKNKTEIAKAHLDQIDLGGTVIAYASHVTREETARRLRDCDVVMGCTDKELPRAILTQLAIKYHLPVLDMGVLIDSQEGLIRGVFGRVTTLMPGEACLFCRGRISPEQIRVEALSKEERAAQAREGYAPELEEPAPAVIAFTSSVASTAVAELLHRLTAFMGAERRSSEVLITFNENRIRTNRLEPREECFCSDSGGWGRGDEDPFLGLMWAGTT
jgi:molybdopterin/thiamine biosynthesis adenylyltransferase